MKNYLFLAVVAIMTSCSVSDIDSKDQQTRKGEKVSLYANIAGKTVLQPDETSVWWQSEEQISVFYGTTALGKFISDNTSDSATATFESEDEITANLATGEDFVAVYPYDTKNTYDGTKVTIPLNLKYQIGEIETFAPKVFPCAAKGAGPNMVFYNLCGGVKFMVDMDDVRSVTFTANDPEAVVAADRISFSFVDGKPVVDPATAVNPSNSITIGLPEGYSFDTDTYYYIAALPTSLDGGFTMTFNTSSKQAVKVSNTNLVIKRGIFGNVGKIDKNLTYLNVEPIDLSETETANCYLVSTAGTYKIKTVKGNTSDNVGSVASAAVLWESYGTDVAPVAGSLVHSVSYSGGYITFKTTGLPGNAVIAAKDAGGDIVWSWHIWSSPAAPMDQAYYNTAGTKVFTMLDRNLGATSITPGSVGSLGLLYQWGRKDPFLGSSSITEGVRAASTITWPDHVTSNETYGTIAFAIANPTTFIGGDATSKDWLQEGDGKENTRWNRDKGVYDPCPAGYKLPFANGVNYPWRSALEGTAKSVSAPDSYDADTRCLTLTDVFHTDTPCYYPLCGYGGNGDGHYIEVGTKALYWSCAPSGTKVVELYIQQSGTVNAWYTDSRANLAAVRCLKK
ncbi:MAG: hypothetical protein IJ686_00955 [Bacteroidales bacterium]|nr:hypothetical protein [Bacteroidales bacterium]